MTRAFLIAAAALVLALIWSRPELPIYGGTDAGCYARISAEIAARPLSAWPELTWGNEPFFEHPPGALWVESLWFRAFGHSARAGVALAHLWATLIMLAALLVARRISGERVAALSLLALASFGGFFFESQNLMFELPLTAAMGFAIVGIVYERAWLFAAAFTFAFFVKGPPALAVFAPLGWWAIVHKRSRFAVTAGALAIAACVLAAVLFESARAARGLPPFFATYFDHQVRASLISGRHNPNSNPFFYLSTMAASYGPLLIALPVCLALRRRDRLFQLGALWVLAIVGGFSLAKQKYAWYVHPSMLGAAWVTGVALEVVVARLSDRVMLWGTRLLAVTAAGWFVFGLVATVPPSPLHAACASMEQIAWPSDPVPRTVADCSPLGDWRATHLFALYWQAERRACDDSTAAFSFDGKALRRY